MLSVERDSPDGNIRTLGDAVWWSFTTMTTVGYGDHAPTTGLGRMLAVGLMLSGIALLGVVTANIAAWFISRFEKDDVEERRQTAAIEALTDEVRALRAEVAALTGGPGPAAPAGGPRHCRARRLSEARRPDRRGRSADRSARGRPHGPAPLGARARTGSAAGSEQPLPGPPASQMIARSVSIAPRTTAISAGTGASRSSGGPWRASRRRSPPGRGRSPARRTGDRADDSDDPERRASGPVRDQSGHVSGGACACRFRSPPSSTP